MVEFPNAKINLGLYVLGKRNDGYHDISTCFFHVSWKDALEIIPSPDKFTSISISGNAIPGTIDENLCYQAVKIIQKDFDIPDVRIHLHKVIPVGAGLGGGSSDAAFTIKILDKLFHLFLDVEIMTWYAAKLGSDCSFFLFQTPKLASGRGEVLTDIGVNLSGKWVIIVYPGIPIQTAGAYEYIVPEIPETPIRDIIENQPISNWKSLLVNDFEAVVFKKYPELGMIKENFYKNGAVFASMSGSGSGIYAIYNEEPPDLPQFPVGYQVWSGLL